MKHVVAIASGKGGVGKSTVAVNLAVALANLDGAKPPKVALIDCDFYGPSVPTLMGGGEVYPDSEGKLVPAERFGIKYVSVAFFLRNSDDPIIWRGPMLGKAMQQLFNDVNWGDIDICIVDLPPGTGDTQLSLSQQVELAGVVMVTTPQEVALADVRRAINMFGKVNVDVLGVIENMAGFKTPDGQRFDVFGQGGGQSLCDQYNLKMLGSLPLDMDIRAGGDNGTPAAVGVSSDAGNMFRQIANDLWNQLQQTAATKEPKLKIVN
jgi:ATP-binding protein involved in chromosome partitioning